MNDVSKVYYKIYGDFIVKFVIFDYKCGADSYPHGNYYIL